MRKKIQSNMILVIVTTLAIAYAITISFVYIRIRGLAAKDVKFETEYITTATNIAGEQYLKELDDAEPGTRVTLIDPDGNVIYDTVQDEYSLENHRNRPEVQEALKTGYGEDIRRSDTIHQDLFYAAQRLDNGNILRVSKPVRSAFFTALELLPFILLIGGGMLVFAMYFSNRQAKKLIEPINQLDLDNPLENDVYEELSPLLHRIDEQNRQKDELADMRKQFSANVSHELKTPLTSISGYAEIIRDGLVRPEDIPDFSNRIYKEANRLVLLINDIIKLSELDEDEVSDEMQPEDLSVISRDVITRLTVKAKADHIHLEFSGEPSSVMGIRRLLDEMIYNIVDNAIKYSHIGGTVFVSVHNNRNRCTVVVADQGIGIAEDEKERIFERFYRVDKSRSKEKGGTGLGLSIVKHGAKIHDAKISVESELGKGTTMTLIFPNTDSWKQIQAAKEAKREERAKHHAKKIEGEEE